MDYRQSDELFVNDLIPIKFTLENAKCTKLANSDPIERHADSIKYVIRGVKTTGTVECNDDRNWKPRKLQGAIAIITQYLTWDTRKEGEPQTFLRGKSKASISIRVGVMSGIQIKKYKEAVRSKLSLTAY